VDIKNITVDLANTGVGCIEWCKEQSFNFITNELIIIPAIITIISMVVVFAYHVVEDDAQVTTIIDWGIHLNLLLMLGYLTQIWLLKTGRF